MNHNPLTSDFLQYYYMFFKHVKADIDILDSFFFGLSNLVSNSYHADYTGEIQKVIEKTEFKSIDEANVFLEKFQNFMNSIIAYIEKLETMTNGKRYDEEIDSLFDMFVYIYNKDFSRLAKILLKQSTFILSIIFDHYDISFKRKNETSLENLTTLFGEDIAKSITALMILIGLVDTEKEKTSFENLQTFFFCCVTLVVSMNFFRKKEFSAKMEQQNRQRNLAKTNSNFNIPKVGRNEPCPCGSGKKYKKCCLDKNFKGT